MNNIDFSIFTNDLLEKYGEQFEVIFIESELGIRAVNVGIFDKTYLVPLRKLIESGLCTLNKNQLIFNKKGSIMRSFYDLVRPRYL